MRSLFLSILVAVALALTGTTAAAETWTVASEENFPPYNFEQDGARAGMDTEIVDAVLKHIGVTPEHRGLPWSRVVNDLDQNQIDIAFQFVGRPDRFEHYNMVGPHRTGLTVLAVPAGSTLVFNGLDDLKGLTVGTVQGFSYTPEFDASGLFRKEAAVNNTLNVLKLAGGRLDAIIGDLHTLTHIARQERMVDRIRFLPKPLAEVPRYIAFPKPRADKAERFAKGLEELKENGAIGAIVRKWTAL